MRLVYKMAENKLETRPIGKPAMWLIDAAWEIGIDISGLIHEITNYFVNHCTKRHGDAEMEKAQGQLPIMPADISRIPDIVKAPDYAIIGIKRNGETLIAYSKKIDGGTIIYYEEVLNSRKNKVLRSKTIYKKMGTVNEQTFMKIVANNAHTDMSNTKMVVGTGGHPGGEAE
jgi:hypothetical protein